MSKKTNQRDSSSRNHVLRRIYETRTADAIANVRTVSNNRAADRLALDELNQIMPPCWVKIFDNGEIFWVEVHFVIGEIIVGVVDNHLLKPHVFEYGDAIFFEKADVIDILWP